MVSVASPFHFVCSTFGLPPVLEAHFVLPEGKSLLTPTSSPSGIPPEPQIVFDSYTVLCSDPHQWNITSSYSEGLCLFFKMQMSPNPKSTSGSALIHEKQLSGHLLFQLINEYYLFSPSSQTSKRFQITRQLQIWFRCQHQHITCALTQCLENVQALYVVQPVGSCSGVLGNPSPALSGPCKLPNQRLSKMIRNLELA